MQRFAGLMMSLGVAVASLPAGAVAQDSPDLIRTHLYSGALAEGLAAMQVRAEEGDAEAAFGAGLFTFLLGVEAFAQPLYIHGFDPGRGAGAAATMLGIPLGRPTSRGTPEPLTYDDLRGYLEAFVTDMDTASELLLAASASDVFAVDIDVMRIRIDVNGDGVAEPDEAVGAFLAQVAGAGAELGVEAEMLGAPEIIFAFDAADAIWLAGYSHILATQADFLLAHDFSDFFGSFLHRLFPGAGLPMETHRSTGTLFMDRDSDSMIADTIAAIHTISWPVTDKARLAGVAERLRNIIDLSRRNWAAILAETDDHLEFMPAPRQTPVHPDMAIDKAMVDAWLETLDALESIIAGDLLLPHWRFPDVGFDLAAYFERAERTDLVLLFSGYDALPFLRTGPIADAQSFDAANSVFGDAIWGYALWFN